MSQLDETHTEQAELKQLLNSPSVQVREWIRFFRKIKQISLNSQRLLECHDLAAQPKKPRRKSTSPTKRPSSTSGDRHVDYCSTWNMYFFPEK